LHWDGEIDKSSVSGCDYFPEALMPVKHIADPEEDLKIAESYKALPPSTLINAARALHIGIDKLNGVLCRTGTPRTPYDRRLPKTEPEPKRKGYGAIPAGHPLGLGSINKNLESLKDEE
jgi:hypothetical protein